MNIKGLRLRTGEEIFAEIVNKTETHYILKQPAVAVPVGDKGQMQFHPWVPFAVNDVHSIPVAEVLFQYDIPKQLEDFYLQTVGKIQLASAEQTKQILLG